MNRALDRDRRSTTQAWLAVVSAVDYLSRGHRPGLTVYDALEEALRWHTAWSIDGHDDVQLPALREQLWDDPDPLHTVVGHLVADHAPGSGDEPTLGGVLHQALRVWVTRMSEQYNSGQPWVHPLSR